MFGKISDKILHQLHDAFDCLGCQDIRTPDFESFQILALNTIVHISNIAKCGNRINAYRLCKQNWKTVKRIFAERMDDWLAIPFYGLDTNIHFRTDEEIKSAFLITNGMTTDGRKFYLFHWDEKFKVKSFKVKGNTYSYDGTVMKLPTSEKMNIYNDQRRKLCSMTLGPKWYMVELHENNSDFIIRNVNNRYLAIVRKEDESKLKNDEEQDEPYYVGKLIWGSIDSSGDYGLARLIILQNVLESEKLFLIQLATAPFLILHAIISMKSSTAIPFLDFQYDLVSKQTEKNDF